MDTGTLDLAVDINLETVGLRYNDRDNGNVNEALQLFGQSLFQLERGVSCCLYVVDEGK
jgi:hypothetical protein